MAVYPKVLVDLGKIRHNAATAVNKCGAMGIECAGVIKGFNALPEAAAAYKAGGVRWIASSRLDQIQRAKGFGVEGPFMLIRIPMLSEATDVVRFTDISLNSELSVLEALNREAEKQGKVHEVIIMADLGDLREGFWDKDELIRACVHVEKNLVGLRLAGIGTNLGCYGSISATPEKLDELTAVAESVEAAIGRRLDWISGGATSSLPRVFDNNMPCRINQLRIGEGVILAKDLADMWGCDMSDFRRGTFVLQAEIVEIKDKPSYPVGEIFIDAFGHRPEYTDRGIRRRAVLAVGKVDYGSDPGELIPREKGIEILGASSDHTLIDIEDAEKEYKVGDIMEFDICYATIVYLTNCPNVNIEFMG